MCAPPARAIEHSPFFDFFCNPPSPPKNSTPETQGNSFHPRSVAVQTPLEREIESIEGLRQFSQKPPAEARNRGFPRSL